MAERKALPDDHRDIGKHCLDDCPVCAFTPGPQHVNLGTPEQGRDLIAGNPFKGLDLVCNTEVLGQLVNILARQFVRITDEHSPESTSLSSQIRQRTKEFPMTFYSGPCGNHDH